MADNDVCVCFHSRLNRNSCLLREGSLCTEICGRDTSAGCRYILQNWEYREAPNHITYFYLCFHQSTSVLKNVCVRCPHLLSLFRSLVFSMMLAFSRSLSLVFSMMLAFSRSLSLVRLAFTVESSSAECCTE